MRDTLKAFEANKRFRKRHGHATEIGQKILNGEETPLLDGDGEGVSQKRDDASSSMKDVVMIEDEGVSNEPPRIEIHYPPEPDASNVVTLTDFDLSKLKDPKGWFSASLIDFFCRSNDIIGSNDMERPDVFTFTALLWDAIGSGPWRPMSRAEDIFSKRFVNLFVNPKGLHWSLCTIVGLDVLSVCIFLK